MSTMTFYFKCENANYSKTTTINVKWNLSLVTGDNIDLKYGTSSQFHEKNLFLLLCVIHIILNLTKLLKLTILAGRSLQALTTP